MVNNAENNMQFKHYVAGQELMQKLFPKTYTAEGNPFYAFREMSKEIFGDKIHGYTNQMFSTKIRPGVYELNLGLVLNFQKSTRETAYVMVTCRYNEETKKLTQIRAGYTLNQYATKPKALDLKRSTGTVETMYGEIAKLMNGIILADIEAHWKGFKEYYSKKVNNMTGYHLD
jgi:hypothetical protein